MRKLCCILIALLVALMPFGAALASSDGLTPEPNDLGSPLIDWEMELSSAAGLDGSIPKPGTMLLLLLRAGQQVQSAADAMPEDDWGRLAYMLENGLAQYGLDATAEVSGEMPGKGEVSASLTMDAGMDGDGCFAMDGSVSATGGSEGMDEETYSDGMYMRYNQHTGDQRIKLPFMDEMQGNGSADSSDEQRIQQMITESLTLDAEHWATALDILYERLRVQPEIEPLTSWLFEGGRQPDDYSLNMQDLVLVMQRLLRDLSGDMRFVDALSQTCVTELVLEQMGLGISIDALQQGQKKSLLIGAMGVLSIALNDTEWGSLPKLELRLHKGALALTVMAGADSYGRYENHFDLSYTPNPAGGFDLRATRADGDQSWQFSWAMREPHQNRVSFTARDDSDQTLVMTLDTGDDGLRASMATDAQQRYGNYLELDVKRGDGGAFTISGTQSDGYGSYELTGGGRCTAAGLDMALALDVTDMSLDQKYRAVDAHLKLRESHLSVGYEFAREMLPIDYQGSMFELAMNWSEDQLNGTWEMKRRGMILDAALDMTRSDGAWDGALRVTGGDDNEPDAFKAGGPVHLDDHSLTVDLAAMAGGSEGSIRLLADWDEAHANVIAQIEGGGEAYGIQLKTATDAGLTEGSAALLMGGMEVPVFHFEYGETRMMYELDLLALGLGSYLHYEFDLNPDDFKWSVSSIESGIETAIALTSKLQDGTRHTRLLVREDGTDAADVRLDSRVALLDDGWTYDLKLVFAGGGDEPVAIGLVGEDHYVLDMGAAAMFTLNQQARMRVEIGEQYLDADLNLIHTVREGTRAHSEPIPTERIVPQPTPQPVVEPRQEPTEPEPPVVEPEPEPIEPEPAVEEGESESYVDDEGLVYELVEGGACLTGYQGSETGVFAPDTVGGYPLIAVGEGAFSGRTDLGWMYLPGSVVWIAEDAFEGCDEYFVLVGERGSATEEYADAHGIIFAPIDGDEAELEADADGDAGLEDEA